MKALIEKVIFYTYYGWILFQLKIDDIQKAAQPKGGKGK